MILLQYFSIFRPLYTLYIPILAQYVSNIIIHNGLKRSLGIKRKMNDSAFPFSFLGFMKNASAKQTIIIFVSKLHCRFKSFKRKIFQK